MSKSPQSSPLFFVNKKDRGKRPCQDYQYINEWTIKNAYPLPIIQDLIDGLQERKYFTKLNIRWGYNNIQIREVDEWKAAFRMPQGLFKPTVMFFGLCNSSATFQSIMDGIFYEEQQLGWLKKYINDILIAAIGFIISEGKIEMDPKKIAGIADWPIPTTLKQLRSFLRFGNYY